MCTVAATAKVTFSSGDETSGRSSARGVDNLSNKENFERIATSAGVEGSDVSAASLFFFPSCTLYIRKLYSYGGQW